MNQRDALQIDDEDFPRQRGNREESRTNEENLHHKDRQDRWKVRPE